VIPRPLTIWTPRSSRTTFPPLMNHLYTSEHGCSMKAFILALLLALPAHAEEIKPLGGLIVFVCSEVVGLSILMSDQTWLHVPIDWLIENPEAAENMREIPFNQLHISGELCGKKDLNASS
jgi:hypothetical protein